MKLTTTAQNLRTHARDYNDNQLPYPVFDENTAQADAGNLGSDAAHDGTGDDGRIIAVDAGGVQLPDDTALVYERGRLGRGIVGGGEGAAAGDAAGGPAQADWRITGQVWLWMAFSGITRPVG